VQLLKALNTTVLAIGIFLCISGFIGFQIAFGHGLGDIIYFAMLYALTIVHLIWTIIIRKATSQIIFIAPLIIFSITTLLFCLKATIWRGPEYSWNNGKLFYSKIDTDAYVETEMIYEITNGEKMDYISVHDPKEKYVTVLKVSTPRQNEQFVLIDSGSVIKPDTLKRYMQNIDNNKIILEGKDPFATDSTVQTVYLRGQVSGVRNNKTLFYVNSWWAEKSGR